MSNNILIAVDYISGVVKLVNSGISRKHKSSIDIYKKTILGWISSVKYEGIPKVTENYLVLKPGFISLYELNANVRYNMRGGRAIDSRYMDFIRVVLNTDKLEPKYRHGSVKGLDIKFEVGRNSDWFVFMDIIPLIDEVRIYGRMGSIYSDLLYRDFRDFSRMLTAFSSSLLSDIVYIKYENPETGVVNVLSVYY